jgi:hypothetical protein
MLRGMPAAAPIQTKANAVLNTPGTDDYRAATTAVNDAHTVMEVLTLTNVINELTPDEKREAERVLDALPVHVDTAFVGSLRDALNDNKRINFTWARHPEGRGHYDWSLSTDPDGTVQLGLRTPHGDD